MQKAQHLHASALQQERNGTTSQTCFEHKSAQVNVTPTPPDELPSSSRARSGRRRESEGSGLMPPSHELSSCAKWVNW